MTVTAKDRLSPPLVLLPDNRRMLGHLVVAVNTSVERLAAFEHNCDDIAFGSVMRALIPFVNSYALRAD